MILCVLYYILVPLPSGKGLGLVSSAHVRFHFDRYSYIQPQIRDLLSQPSNSASMIHDHCNPTPEWTKSCCSSRLATQVVLWESATMITLKRPLYSEVSLLQFFRLSWPTIVSQSRQNPLWAEYIRISGIWFLLVSPRNSKDNRSLLSCKCDSRKPMRRAEILLALIFRSQLRSFRNTSSSFPSSSLEIKI